MKRKQKICDTCIFKHRTHEHCLTKEFVNPLPEARTCELWQQNEELEESID